MTISGSNFQTNISFVQVRVDDTYVTIIDSSPSRLIVTLPPLVGTNLEVEVIVDGMIQMQEVRRGGGAKLRKESKRDKRRLGENSKDVKKYREGKFLEERSRYSEGGKGE